jgi:hypothetical protein
VRIAAEACEKIKAFYAMEADIRGQGPDARCAIRQEQSRPLTEALEPWLRGKLETISQKTKLAEAIRYALPRWTGLTRLLGDGCIEIDNNSVERSIRPLAVTGKNSLFAGSFAGSCGGAEHWAILASLIETAKLNAIDPEVYITDAITWIVQRHPQSQIDQLMLWNQARGLGTLAP